MEEADAPLGREELSDQKALADEIGNAIANGPQAGEPLDEAELEDELAELEQQKLDNELINGGRVPVLPTGPQAERESPLVLYSTSRLCVGSMC